MVSPSQPFGGTDAEGEGRIRREAEEDIQKIQHGKAPDVAGSERGANARKGAIREATGSRKARVKTARTPGFMGSAPLPAHKPARPWPGNAAVMMSEAPGGTDARMAGSDVASANAQDRALGRNDQPARVDAQAGRVDLFLPMFQSGHVRWRPV